MACASPLLTLKDGEEEAGEGEVDGDEKAEEKAERKETLLERRKKKETSLVEERLQKGREGQEVARDKQLLPESAARYIAKVLVDWNNKKENSFDFDVQPCNYKPAIATVKASERPKVESGFRACILDDEVKWPVEGMGPTERAAKVVALQRLQLFQLMAYWL